MVKPGGEAWMVKPGWWSLDGEAWMVKAGWWRRMVKAGWWRLDGEAYFDIFKWLIQLPYSESSLGPFFLLFTVERGKTWKISSCVITSDSLLGTAHCVTKSPRPLPSPCLHILKNLTVAKVWESVYYISVYLFKVEIASIRSTGLFSTSHIQKTECRKVGLS